jgi:hypothetical protein
MLLLLWLMKEVPECMPSAKDKVQARDSVMECCEGSSRRCGRRGCREGCALGVRTHGPASPVQRGR